jgi:peptidyl-prolyl cis-trans isomerase C
MLRRLAASGLVLVAVIACSKDPKKSGPAVAKGKGVVITADEFKARIDEQSPFLRARYSSLDRKKEFLDTLVRFEVLAAEAERQGLDKDPTIQLELKKKMVQLLVQKTFQDDKSAPAIPDDQLKAYYDEHFADFNKPRKVRAQAIVLAAAPGTPDRAKKADLAKKALAQLKADEKKNPNAFAVAAGAFSDDQATKAMGGDLNFKSQDELEKAYSKELAQAAFGLQPGQTSGVVETPTGLAIVKVNAEQAAFERPFDTVKQQIQAKLTREKKTKDFDAWLKKLRDDAGIQVDEKALEKVEIAAPAAPPPGMGGPGMGMGMGAPMGMAPGGHGGMGGMPAPGPMAPVPAPASAPGAHP